MSVENASANATDTTKANAASADNASTAATLVTDSKAKESDGVAAKGADKESANQEQQQKQAEINYEL